MVLRDTKSAEAPKLEVGVLIESWQRARSESFRHARENIDHSRQSGVLTNTVSLHFSILCLLFFRVTAFEVG